MKRLLSKNDSSSAGAPRAKELPKTVGGRRCSWPRICRSATRSRRPPPGRWRPARPRCPCETGPGRSPVPSIPFDRTARTADARRRALWAPPSRNRRSRRVLREWRPGRRSLPRRFPATLASSGCSRCRAGRPPTVPRKRIRRAPGRPSGRPASAWRLFRSPTRFWDGPARPPGRGPATTRPCPRLSPGCRTIPRPIADRATPVAGCAPRGPQTRRRPAHSASVNCGGSWPAATVDAKAASAERGHAASKSKRTGELTLTQHVPDAPNLVATCGESARRRKPIGRLPGRCFRIFRQPFVA